jgi:type I restriction enzyme S subunit
MNSTTPLKFVTSINGRIGWHGLSTDDYRDEGDFLITGTEFVAGKIDWSRCHRVSGDVWERDPMIQIKEDDVLVTKDGTIGKVAYVPKLSDRATLNSGVFRVRSDQRALVPQYLYWVLNSNLFSDFIELLSAGSTIKHLYQRDFVNFKIPVLSLNDQRAIASHLDRETARIDALIEKKQRIVELVGERFETLVFDAVSGAWLSNTPMKSSGLTWITEIPETWGIPPVLANFEIQLGKMLNSGATDGPEQYPYLRNTNVQWDEFDFDDIATMHFDADDRRKFELREGDVLVCEGGEVGRSAVWEDGSSICYYQKAIHRVRPRRSTNGRYLMYCLRAAAKMSVFAVEGNQSTIVHLTGEQLRAHRFPWPPSGEQDLIVARLDRAAAATTSAKEVVETQISLLIERRQALITAVVTGQLEIPGVAA